MLLSVTDYVRNREAYGYSDLGAEFTIVPTGTSLLPHVGTFHGILPRVVPSDCPRAVNLRRFERLCQSVFQDCRAAASGGRWTELHLQNLRHVACAIVHWKMASQGGRAGFRVKMLLEWWTPTTHHKLMRAGQSQNLSDFCIPGVAIPTASAFLRFLRPDEFGIIDSRVAVKVQAAGITTLSIRDDGYISDTPANRSKYSSEYIPFLRAEGHALSRTGVTFEDRDENGARMRCSFRPCDVEMALFTGL